MAHFRTWERLVFVKIAVIGVCLIALWTFSSIGSAQSWQSISDSALGNTYIINGKLTYRPARKGTRTIVVGLQKTVPFSYLGVIAMDQNRFSVAGITANLSEFVSIRCEGPDLVMLTWEKNNGTGSENGLSGSTAQQTEKLKVKKEDPHGNQTEPPENSESDLSEEKQGNSQREPDFIVYEQQKDKPVRLVLQFRDSIDVLEAPTFWHLLLECSPEQRRYLTPLFQRFNHNWSLDTLFHQTCYAVTKTANFSQNQQTVYTKWISDLSSDSYSVREQAENQLRQSGEAAIVYLKTLDLKTLDPEAGYRIYRILTEALPVVQTDQAEEKSSLLSDQTWPLAVLLASDKPEYYTFAEKKLRQLLKEEYRYDLSADDAERQTQMLQIRQKTNYPTIQTVPFDAQSNFGKSWAQFRKSAINPEQKNLLVLPELPLPKVAQ